MKPQGRYRIQILPFGGILEKNVILAETPVLIDRGARGLSRQKFRGYLGDPSPLKRRVFLIGAKDVPLEKVKIMMARDESGSLHFVSMPSNRLLMDKHTIAELESGVMCTCEVDRDFLQAEPYSVHVIRKDWAYIKGELTEQINMKKLKCNMDTIFQLLEENYTIPGKL